MKKLTMAGVVLFVSCLPGVLFGQEMYKKLPERGFSPPKEYKKSTDYGFALINESDESIGIQLTNGDATLINFIHIPSAAFKGGKLQGIMAQIDLSKKTKLIVQHDRQLTTYTFAPNKTIYVRWRRNKLSPQSGKLFGLRPYSKAGFLLENNVQPGDIKKS